MDTVVDINNVFKEIVTKHIQLQKFYTFSLDEIDIDKITIDLFPLLYAQVTNMQIDNGVTVFTYEVIVADLTIEKQTDLLTQVYAETALIMQDVIAQFVLSMNSMSILDSNTQHWGFTTPISCDPFTARFSNLLTGWQAQFEIRVPNAINLCIAPYTS
jgi:hypothetical protein|tara:strand:- start:68 stop:541 length:474 start_codon:yes stop_codon:yes gene_type:complete